VTFRRLVQAVVHGWFITASLLSAEFPKPFSSETRGGLVTAAEAAATFQLPPGFKVSVFASEPDLNQPIAMTFDPRGRLWVAENYTYAEAGVNFATNLNDRVLIFEDENHDGRFDKRTVFWDQAKILTSVEVGLGGVFVLCPPKLLFLADRNGDDRPDGEPEVLLDGFTTTGGNRHTFANGLKWGPDGWLWGRIGISSGAKIGVPGTAEADRVEMRGGIWRYHPIRRVFEAVSHGTTNPWGLDWNEAGEPFFINTVIGHLWHAIPGAHFQRMHGDDVDPHAYALIGQHADHYHFDTGAGWQKSRAAFDGSTFAAGSDELGGGHAHCGLMIYQGDNWPAEYRGKLFTINLHGRRLNVERLERQGSGYVGKHDRDFLQIGDPWFRGLDLIQGPDGGVFIADWSDTGECHDHDGVHRTSGRIYKVTYGEPKPPAHPDISRATSDELLGLLTDSNEWLARQARRVIADRQHAGLKSFPSVTQLQQEFGKQTKLAARLRVLWAMNVLGPIDTGWLTQRITGSTRDGQEAIRSWAVRLLADSIPELQLRVADPATSLVRREAAAAALKSIQTVFVERAQLDQFESVLLYLTAALQKLAVPDRAALALALVARTESARDHNLPLLLWTGLEPLLAAQPDLAVPLTKAATSPQLRQFIARRLAEDLETKPGPVASLLEAALGWPEPVQADLVRGLGDGLRGWRKATAPGPWKAFSEAVRQISVPDVEDQLRGLNLLFGDGRALDDLKQVLADGKADPTARRTALRTLLAGNAAGLAPLLRTAADDGALRPTALVGLLQLGEADAPAFALQRYQWLGLEERPAVLGALVTRPVAAKALLDAVAAGRVARADVTAFHARQIAGLGDAALARQLGEVWGTVKVAGETHAAELARWRTQLTPDRLQAANLPNGRKAFAQACAPCHQLYGEGGRVGPDLTGSGRASLDYLLENIVAPSAVVAADYRMTVATLKDGSVLNGVLREPTARTVTFQSQTESRVLDRGEIQSLESSDQSMMPEGLLTALPANDARDLLAYLMHPRQVPLGR
jgi:putative membrane-bound dehydrogenase-like protein